MLLMNVLEVTSQMRILALFCEVPTHRYFLRSQMAMAVTSGEMEKMFSLSGSKKDCCISEIIMSCVTTSLAANIGMFSETIIEPVLNISLLLSVRSRLFLRL